MIFQAKKKEEPFILSNGHAGLALYVVLEKWGYAHAEELFDKHGVHPNRDIANVIMDWMFIMEGGNHLRFIMFFFCWA